MHPLQHRNSDCLQARLDALQETLQAYEAQQLGRADDAAVMHCDVLVLGCDELYTLDAIPDELRGDLEQVLTVLHAAVGKHSGVLGVSLSIAAQACAD